MIVVAEDGNDGPVQDLILPKLWGHSRAAPYMELATASKRCIYMYI